MKPSFRLIRCTGWLAFSLAASGFSPAGAQPNVALPAPAVGSPIPQGISASTAGGELTMRLNVQKAGLLETLKKTARLGNLQVVTRGEIKGEVSVAAKGAPEEVLQALATSAGVSCRQADGVWIVGETRTAPPTGAQNRQLTLLFEQVETRQLIKLIAEQAEVQAVVAPEIQGQIDFLRLNLMSAPEIFARIALAADLDLVEKDGKWFFSAKTPVGKADTVAAPAQP